MLAVGLAAVLFLTGVGCKGSDQPDPDEESSQEEEDMEYPVEVGAFSLRSRPGDVVSLSPALTEKLYDLGFGSRLTGVSDFCDYPPEAESLPRCGTAQLPDIEAIKELSPDLVLSSAALPEGAWTELQQSDIEVVVLPPVTDLAALSQTYLDMARLLEGNTTGAQIGDLFVSQLEDKTQQLARTMIDAIGEESRKSVLYVRVLDFNVATGDTLEQQLLDLIGLDNAAEAFTGWTVPEESWKELAPTVIFSDNSITMKMFEQNAYYKGMKAVIGDVWMPVDGAILERQSLRSLDLMVEMAKYAYPEADLAGFTFARESGEPAEEASEPDASGEDSDQLPLPSSIN